MRLVWDERFSVGILALDEQHKELMAMINQLIDHEEADTGSEHIAEILDRMTRYAEYHFHTEEQLLTEYSYPENPSHEKEHTRFKTQIARFCMDAIHRNKDLRNEILFYLRNWLKNHILKSDMKYKSFFQEKGLR